MKASEFASENLAANLFRRHPLLNQFTGREPRASQYDYCYGEAGVLVARLSNLANASRAGDQIER